MAARRQVTRIGRAIRTRREAQGLSLRNVGARAFVSYSYVGKIERGWKQHPSPAIVRAIAHGLKCHVSELLLEPEPVESVGASRTTIG